VVNSLKFPKINLQIKLPKPDFHDFLIIFGGIFLGKGLYMIYPPSMFIIIGVAVIWLGLPGKVVK
jgi:hypothetical protein